MKKALFRISIILLLSLTFVTFASCGNLIQDFKTSKTENLRRDTGTITINLNGDSSRTALPQVYIFSLNDFKLYYKQHEASNYVLLKEWNDYNALKNGILEIPQGIYDFKLTVSYGHITYSDTKLTTTIINGLNQLSFSLKITEIDMSLGEGAFQITVDYSNTQETISVVTASLFTQDDQPVAECQEEILTLSQQKQAIYSKNGLPTGTYHVIFNLYHDPQKNCLLSTFQETVIVIKDLLSTSKVNITIVNPYYDYPITFVLNGLQWKHNFNYEDYLLKGSRFSYNDLLLPTQEDLDLIPDATFYGWYTSPCFEEDSKISFISYNTARLRKTLYAKSNQISVDNLINLLYSMPEVENEISLYITNLREEDFQFLHTLFDSFSNCLLDLYFIGELNVSTISFSNPNIRHISIPETVTQINFSYCEGLISVNIPDSFTNINAYAFQGCTSLTSINIPESVTSIGNYAFQNCSNLTTLSIPDSVTSIGNSAFDGCSSLTSITLPDTLTTIPMDAFSRCSSLSSISIPESVTNIEAYAFFDCTNLTSIDIPNSVTSIGDEAFSYCQKLETINIPESVTSIGDQAFSYCSSLTSITIPDSVTYLGFGIVDNCENLTSINISESLSDCNSYLFYKYNNGNTVVIPNSFTSISDNAFSYCSSLTSITIPDSVISIGNRAFSGCSNLTSITIPEFVTSIGNSAFSNCSNLTSITIPNSVTSIGIGAFAFCNNLTSVIISNSITSIENATFSYCLNLNSITIPDSVTSIGEQAFYDCKKLKSLTIPESVTFIDKDAFKYCNITNMIFENPQNWQVEKYNDNSHSYEWIPFEISYESLFMDVFYNGCTLRRVTD